MAKQAVAKVAPSDEEADAKEGEAAPADAPKKKGLVGKIFGIFGFLRFLNPLAILKLKGWMKWAAIGGLAVVLLGGGAFFFLMGGSDEAAANTPEGEAAEAPAVQATFYDVPDIIVNIQSADGTPAYLKLAVALELEGADAKTTIEPLMPRVIDQFQAYLRELRVDDIKGSAGVIRLKEELLRRVNLAVAPTQVKEVLLKEMIVQ